ncbi:MAG TPA: ABC transporter substrate-binding protein [Pseudobdellovibrionaceae bacterium]|nr:ABC transporter substrate-binding protein [Pseudobdellovibrionaceae bacterium]
MKRPSCLLALLLVPSLLWAAKPREIKIQLNWKPEPQFGGFYAANLAKVDEAQGLAFNPRPGGSGTPTVQLLVNEKIDFAIVSAEEILISNDRNPKKPVIALFAVYQTNPQMIMCHAEKKFESLKDVFASSVTLSWQSGLSYAQFLRKKYPKTKVKFAPYSGGIGAFVGNKNLCQQGFVTSEPLLANKAGRATRNFLVSEEGFNPYTTVLAVRKNWLEKNQELAKKVVSITRSGWVSYLENTVPTNAYMNQLNPAMDLRTAMESAKAQEKLIRPTDAFQVGEMSADRWQRLIRQLKDMKLIKTELKAADQFAVF